ncbi:MAG: putative acetyltransferase, partial [Pseudonocardia sp.]
MHELFEWVGRRVALRHRVGERDGRPLHSDAVGELADAGPDEVVVHARRGPVRVARAAVVAVRLVPPAPPRRASWAAVARLANLCADARPAPVDEPLGAWRLRAGGAGRAGGALVLGDPGMPVEAALDALRAFAARHATAPRVQVPAGSPWERAVVRHGWVADQTCPEVAVLVGDLRALAAA